jgi:hypothetical protein
VVDGDATNVATAKADYANLDALAFDVLDLLDPGTAAIPTLSSSSGGSWSRTST